MDMIKLLGILCTILRRDPSIILRLATITPFTNESTDMYRLVNPLFGLINPLSRSSLNG